MLIERLLILAGLLALGALLLIGCRLWQVCRLRRLAAASAPVGLEVDLPAGPALLYFTTPTCTQCRLQQTPILADLTRQTQVAVHMVDAVEAEGLVRFLGIMTVPTTVWVDQQRRPLAINHGLTPLAQLRRQALEFGVH